VLLAGELGERARPHALGQRLAPPIAPHPIGEQVRLARHGARTLAGRRKPTQGVFLSVSQRVSQRLVL
jgi:hypothetical protein